MSYTGTYMKQENLVGRKYGHLLVIRQSEKKTGVHRYWGCQCDCGNICLVYGTHLKSGHTKSCGCYRRKRQTHGWLDLTGERYGRLLALGPWKEDSPYLDMVKDGNSGMDGRNKGANAEKQYYDTFLKKYHGEQSGAESEGRE